MFECEVVPTFDALKRSKKHAADMMADYDVGCGLGNVKLGNVSHLFLKPGCELRQLVESFAHDLYVMP